MRSEVTETQTHLTHQPSGRGEEEKATIRLISQSAKTQSKINLHWLSHSVSKERLHICHHLNFRDCSTKTQLYSL